MPRVPRGGCGPVASAGAVEYAWTFSDTATVTSGAWPSATTVTWTAGFGNTNAPATFDFQATGLFVKRGGWYAVTFFGAMSRSVAIAVHTVRGWIFSLYTVPASSIDSLEQSYLNPAMNVSLTGAAPGDSPQKWEPVNFIAANYPDTAPAFPYRIGGASLGQNSGGNASGSVIVYAERLADGIA